METDGPIKTEAKTESPEEPKEQEAHEAVLNIMSVGRTVSLSPAARKKNSVIASAFIAEFTPESTPESTAAESDKNEDTAADSADKEETTPSLETGGKDTEQAGEQHDSHTENPAIPERETE